MVKNKEISSHKVAQMVILRQEGLTQTAIAARLGINQSMVSRHLKTHAQTGSYSARKRTGRPRLTSPTTDRLIRRMVVMDPRVTSATIASNLPLENAVSSSTVRRRLSKELNLKSYHPAPKPMLSPKNVRDRLAFCHRYRHWTANQWRQVMFSDESTVRQFAVFRPRVRRPRGQRFHPKIHVNDGQTLRVSHDLGVHFGSWQRRSLVHPEEYNGQSSHLPINSTTEATNLYANGSLHGVPT